MPKNQYLPREQRKSKIFDLFIIVSREWLSMYDLAKVLDVAPSMHLRSILDEMVQVGVLDCKEVPYRKNVNKKLWKLSERYKSD